MRQLLLTFTIVLFNSLLGLGQDNSKDCLSPSTPRNFGPFKMYEQKVDEILLSQFSNFSLLQFRQSETIWAIELDTTDLKNANYYITSVSPSKSIWHSMPYTDSITAYRKSRNISTEDYILINKLFYSALSGVCASCHNFGIDGASYDFSNGTISGRVWLGKSPTKETKKERLVMICKEINKLINTGSQKIQLTLELRNQIIELTEEFKIQKH